MALSTHGTNTPTGTRQKTGDENRPFDRHTVPPPRWSLVFIDLNHNDSFLLTPFPCSLFSSLALVGRKSLFVVKGSLPRHNFLRVHQYRNSVTPLLQRHRLNKRSVFILQTDKLQLYNYTVYVTFFNNVPKTFPFVRSSVPLHFLH